MALYSIPLEARDEPDLSREWLLTNGLGGFCSSTLVGCNTRRYHGLLCAATMPPVGRFLMLSRLGEILYLDGREENVHELSISQFDGVFHPRGDRYLRRFELDDVARFEFQVEGIRLTKEIQLLWLANVVAVRYRIETDRPRALELRLLPFVAMRDYHGMRRAGDSPFAVQALGGDVSIAVGSLKLRLHCQGASFQAGSDWWFGHTYAVEAERGLDCKEDLFVPGRFIARFEPLEAPVTLTFWAAADGAADSASPPVIPGDFDAELDRRRLGSCELRVVSCENSQLATRNSQLATGNSPLTPSLARLFLAANDFVVFRRNPDGTPGTSILAGYPWFTDWGRDTMISLPGLLLTTGRFAQAKQVLALFANYVSEGMIPNRFEDYTNEPSYNTVDASLWFIHACYEYLRLAGDHHTFEQVLLPACSAIIDGYRRGTRFNIHMDQRDGLITQGDEHTQLTWMDAKCGHVAFTPRQGKPVEINALWYHALRLMNQSALADRVADSFRRAFWINPFRGLADVVRDDAAGYVRDTSVRPNQIIAASLPHSPLDESQQRAVVETVRRELLTPYGLRTLARVQAGYRGRCVGPPAERDAAYHNGTVWPWLIGPFLEAYLRVNGRSATAFDQARRWLSPLVEHLEQACVGQVSEVFDGDEPHHPRGCPAQAWSVAEVLRLAAMLAV